MTYPIYGSSPYEFDPGIYQTTGVTAASAHDSQQWSDQTVDSNSYTTTSQDTSQLPGDSFSYTVPQQWTTVDGSWDTPAYQTYGWEPVQVPQQYEYGTSVYPEFSMNFDHEAYSKVGGGHGGFVVEEFNPAAVQPLYYYYPVDVPIAVPLNPSQVPFGTDIPFPEPISFGDGIGDGKPLFYGDHPIDIGDGIGDGKPLPTNVPSLPYGDDMIDFPGWNGLPPIDPGIGNGEFPKTTRFPQVGGNPLVSMVQTIVQLIVQLLQSVIGIA